MRWDKDNRSEVKEERMRERKVEEKKDGEDEEDEGSGRVHEGSTLSHLRDIFGCRAGVQTVRRGVCAGVCGCVTLSANVLDCSVKARKTANEIVSLNTRD